MPLDRFVDACRPESELVRSLEAAARRFVSNPRSDTVDAAVLRRQFEIWAANDALFQPVAAGNSLLTEAVPLSKDLSALGNAGLKLLEYLTPPPAPDVKEKKPRKPTKKELAAQKAAKTAQAEWLAKENAELDRLAKPPARLPAGQQAPPSADVRLAAYRPVKILADTLHP
jgi:hypothetical protein